MKDFGMSNVTKSIPFRACKSTVVDIVLALVITEAIASGFCDKKDLRFDINGLSLAIDGN